MLNSDRLSHGILGTRAHLATQKGKPLFFAAWKTTETLSLCHLRIQNLSYLKASSCKKPRDLSAALFHSFLSTTVQFEITVGHTLDLTAYRSTHFRCNEKLSVEFNQIFLLFPFSSPPAPHSHAIGARSNGNGLTAMSTGTAAYFTLKDLCSVFPVTVL